MAKKHSSFVVAVALALPLLLFGRAVAQENHNSGRVDMKITVDAPSERSNVRLWVPYPTSDGSQMIEDVQIGGNFSYQGIYREPETGNLALYAEWKNPVKEERFVTFSFKASATERSNGHLSSGDGEIPPEVRPYLQGTDFIPVNGKVKETATSATSGSKTRLEKARAIYDWMVENTVRDPNVKGCGVGDVEATLAERGGKCADLSSVYVALARSVGIPAREVFGLRLGKKSGDLTKGHHCWAEFYLPGTGWVSTDPADVRKLMLVNKLDLNQAKDLREYYFDSVGPNRISLGKGGRGYYLSPRQNDGPLNYFMYPYAEVDGKAVEWLAAQKELKYQITYTKF